ncbi:hypothetical protein [Marilutibacter alkalisoli]|uniref:Uncharacterized protein n=1 Tax=Marilutibacter alkalisoli TaxID=2591633 RepID=A0A514BW39_9GAMM|nr:hypothetical protein [Lysobacter alkalisoli]QDH71601.1 hypothetical protein FKV23_16990 [Lysobacter alkalisoli]
MPLIYRPAAGSEIVGPRNRHRIRTELALRFCLTKKNQKEHEENPMLRHTLSLAILMPLLAVGCADKPGVPAEQAETVESTAREIGSAETMPETTEEATSHALDPAMEAMVQLAAQLSAAAAVCGSSSRAEIDAAATQSRQTMAGRGLSGTDHDRIYNASFRSVERKFEQMSAAERKQSCDELEQLGEAMKEMAEGLPSEQ